jgi:two-component system cell cycle response regulator CtrA
MRVLLIEDDSTTAQSIELMLKSENFNLYTTRLGEEGVDLGKLYDYDIVLLDLNLPDMSGFDVLRSLRVSKVKTPVLILSGLAGIEAKVKGLGFGADDYMTKPFHKEELVARIRAIVRRSKGHAGSVIQTGDLVINLDAKTVEVNAHRVHLTGKEYQMLELLSLRKGTPLSKDLFLNHLYGGMDEPDGKDHRRFHMQAAQEACCPLKRQQPNRNRVGPRLRTARAERSRESDPRHIV